MHPHNPVLFINRSLAYKKKQKFQLMYDDSIQAIELDDQNFKAFVRNGEAHIELGKKQTFKNTEHIEKGIRRLQKALMIIEKIKPSDPNFEKKKLLIRQVEKQVLRGKKIKWMKEQELRNQKIYDVI